MLKTIQNRLIDITLEEHKVIASPFLRFIEKGIESGYSGGIYKPMGDRIGAWKLKANKNYYMELQDLANIKGY